MVPPTPVSILIGRITVDVNVATFCCDVYVECEGAVT